MKKSKNLITAALVICFIACVITASAQSKKAEDVKTEWNEVICIVLKVLQFIAGGIAALVIIVAGIKYLTSENPEDRKGSKSLIIQALGGLVILFIAVQIVNYITTGTKVDKFDMNSCDVLSFTSTSVSSTSSTTGITGPTVTTSTVTTSGSSTTSAPTTTAPLTDHQRTACELADFWAMCDRITVTTPERCCMEPEKWCCP